MIGGSEEPGSSTMHMQRLPQPRRHSVCIESGTSGFRVVLLGPYMHEKEFLPKDYRGSVHSDHIEFDIAKHNVDTL